MAKVQIEDNTISQKSLIEEIKTSGKRVYRRFSLPLGADLMAQDEFYKTLQDLKKQPSLLITKVKPSRREKVAYIIVEKSKKNEEARAAYIVSKTFQEAYMNPYARRTSAGRRSRTRRRYR